MNEYYKLLMQFTRGTKPCRKHLLRNYSPSLIDNAIENGYIVECGKTDIDDPVYRITEKGRQKRDG